MPAAGNGRYAPSPTGDLHLGNLRTAVLAWILAHNSGRDFCLRVEDIDRVRAGCADGQLQDLAALGLTWSEPVVYQSRRLPVYDEVIRQLQERGLVYECYCSRKDILAASSAPHAAPGAYPGTCRDLTERQREQKRAELAEIPGKSPALRLKAGVKEFTVLDEICGSYTGVVDDFVLRRGDGMYAYNLAVVVDDNYQNVTQVCRGDDLIASAPRQAYLASLLDAYIPVYAHVPLVLGPSGQRLAKRDGAVSLKELSQSPYNWDVAKILAWIAESLGVALPVNFAMLPAAYALSYLADKLDIQMLQKLRGKPTVFMPPASR